MGTLLNVPDGVRVLLRGEHVFGRNPARSDTHLADPEVSMVHAVVRFRDGGWSISDHSRNGTFLDDQSVARGQWTPLRVGQTLRFGCSAMSPWQVVEVSPPHTALVPEDPQSAPIVLERTQLLPDPNAPEAWIYQTRDGTWIFEDPQEARPLHDGDVVSIAAERYRLLVCDTIEETTGPASPIAGGSLQLHFHVSSDEEHTTLQVEKWPDLIDLGERSHHYCLLTLARKRVSDARAGLSEEAQGWFGCAELAKLLRIDPQHLNVQIFRVRNQLMSAVPGAHVLEKIVQRRRGALRLGAFAFEIARDTQIEANYRPDSRVAT